MKTEEPELKKEYNHASISPTAVAVAYSRTFSDIPLSEEIFEEMQAMNAQAGVDFTIEQIKEIVPPNIAPMFEARFKLTDKIVKESEIKQVLEMASGFSQRGLVMSQDPSIQYSELDLPGIMTEKKAIVKNLETKGKVTETNNLYFNEGNVLEMEDLLAATQDFEQKPIAILNEGLLRYLNLEERAQVAKNVYQLLSKFDGVWITPDTAVKRASNPAGESMYNGDEKIKQLTGVDVDKYYFKSEDEAQAFFENLGFTVERRSFAEVADQLATPQKLDLPQDKVGETLKRRSMFVMRVKE